jgi:dihydrofolate synthase/folylpolyglutamate synthase
MNYNETMEYIKNTAKFGSNYGLSRTQKILEFLGNPEKKLKCIHIAGTNGKGSTTVMIAEILKNAGYKIGMYTSPFLLEFEERIQVNGKNIPKEDLCQVVSELSKAVEKVVALGYEHPTEFEIITCAAFLYFYKKAVDFVVLEVGLGGRLDSTNVVDPLLCVITSISYDHMNILGNTLKEIASEKAGIIKESKAVILYPQNPESEEVIENTCKEKKCTLIKVNKDSASFIKVYEEDSKYFQCVDIKTETDTYHIKLALLGDYQLLNCSTAIHCIEQLMKLGVKVTKENIENALRGVKWIGRLEVLQNKPTIVIDGAHNIDGIRNLSKSITKYFKYNKLILILGILADKEVEKMVELIAKKAEKIITVTPHSDRAELANDLEVVVKKFNLNCESTYDYKMAISKAKEYCKDDDLLLIAGSLYMIGDMRKILTH